MNRPFAEEVLKIRQAHETRLPAKRRVHQFVDNLLDLLFPHISAETEYFSADEIDGQLSILAGDLRRILAPQAPYLEQTPDSLVTKFFNHLPEIYRRLWLDAQAIHEGDPAAEGIDEVITAYPGFFAIYTYRIAHEFYQQRVPIFPRIMSEYAHLRTGIDIHPGAQIGDSFCIDHGTGVVIGETTVIGERVKLYQGVSLGALSVSKEMSQTKRHPTIEDKVVIYSNATILGGNTVIGHDSVIGGNVWLTESVPALSVVYHKSEVRVRSKRLKDAPIDFQI